MASSCSSELPQSPKLSPRRTIGAIMRGLELTDSMFAETDEYLRTAEIAANSPRFRRRSSTFIDGVHDLPDEKATMAPAQLYSTESGRLFHSGRIAIVLVGLPARGKT